VTNRTGASTRPVIAAPRRPHDELPLQRGEPAVGEESDHDLDAQLLLGDRDPDRSAHSENYVTASLPTLPFTDGRFDLVLSSHLLFCYADRPDREFHLASLRELARVGRDVRVFPLVPMGMAESPELAPVRAALASAGLRTIVHPVDYEFQRGGNTMLTIIGYY